jgi:ribosomal protein L20
MKKRKTNTKGIKTKPKNKPLRKKDLDILWSRLIRDRDKSCVVCGKKPVQAHHIFSRSYNSTRWNLDNGISLCYYHHIYWAHQKYEEFRKFIIDRIGEEKFEELRKYSQQIRQMNKEELELEFQSLNNLIQ